ncbi:alpha/beta hydrolase [Pigmentiphaga soli]|uniref:Alpha/beta hydrolase n=1 Tax=Pigmentiphaga soli TaxID=1007095 RepID=A0ABP8H7R8_9BURK
MQHPTASNDQPRLDFVTCLSPAGLHRMAYWEWGDPGNDKVLLCVHGLTRNGRDFDRLARSLCGEYRVVCPDVAGRGASDWLVDPAFYTVPQYVSDMMPLLARLQAATLHWFGTSMGGLIGMGLASLPGTPISRLVLNDVGPRLDPAALARIGQYVGRHPEFDSVDAALAYLRSVHASFGPHTDDEWSELNRFALRPAEGGQGRWTLHYDPSIAVVFRPMAPEVLAAAETTLWQGYASIACPILVVRGAQSDLLGRDTVAEMAARNPHTHTVEIAGIGHAPTFMHEDQIGLARRFLLAGD